MMPPAGTAGQALAGRGGNGRIDGRTNQVIATTPVGTFPYGIAVNPATHRVYIANDGDDTVSVIAPRG